MLYFSCDYAEGCHPKVLEALTESNLVSTPGYGEDQYCEEAKKKIRDYIKCPDADIYFLVGGTQTNQTVIDSMLSNYDGVVAASTGHVACHEAGAIEYSGHKVITLPAHEGKIDAAELKDMLETHYADASCEHMVNPGMVYISYPTEYGTLYSRSELEAVSSICKEYDMPLFIDGARLAYGLAAQDDLTMADIASFADVFYIGGTKVGALFGEAVVFTRGNTPKHMITQIKQHGALLAKGRLLGVQFGALFTDDLYMEMGRHAIKQASIIREDLRHKGYQLFMENPTNQIFVVMENETLKAFGEKVAYGFWEKYDDSHTVIRIATSWSTSDEAVNELKKIL
ncbi:aminotransferase class I/II-fold pyridoxal phosphate-dependent enzyme [Butyrivibrio fibrisolvens]|uniref:threonine aldolase family protein n=1 Tax=Pseudobutyrivibrio ruminis TaxID=46206 RepID=UPI0003F66D98|nr:aminotransferase class V-fold PLP-dependent enzyme [Pseudobutyrivibrio ruminis]MDC7280418.1 aminotransferase class I/II-fold pyridoxal phosphate-dependent enzyme [Butyrivibrio fibrisolvens]